MPYGNTHQAGTQFILHVTTQDALLDQHGILCRHTLIIHRQRTTTANKGGIIYNGAEGRSHLLPNQPAIVGAALAVEVTLQTVANCFMQQHTTPARRHHHRHAASRRRDRLKVDQCLAYRFADVFIGTVIFQEIMIVSTATATIAATLTAAIVLNNHTDVTAHHGSYISRQGAIQCSHQHMLPGADQVQADD